MHLFGEEPPKPPKEKEVAETPLMKQYNAFKKKHPEAILLFRVGDFYETFGEDAIKASKILNITLTKRANGAAAFIELAGFPHHALDNYLPKLVRAGERVAICDQLEDPKMAKGIVKRGVTELVTPGVAYNDNVLEVRKNNYLAALHFTNHGTVGIALLDISTGEFLAAQGDKEHINRLMQSFQPSEVIYNRKFRQLVEDEFEQQFNTFAIDDWVFQYDYAHEKLTKHFGTVNLKGFGIQDLTESIVAAGAAMYYLESTEHHEIRHITAISRIQEERHVWLDKFTIRNLEILAPQQEGGVPLIDILDHTVTPMGARLLRKWLILPLKNLVTIQERLDLVSAFVQNEDLTDQLLKPLKQIGDIERLISKVAAGRINPREMNHLKRALKNIVPIQQLLTSSKDLQKLANQLNPCLPLLEQIEKTLLEDVPLVANQGGLIAEGVHSELDELRKIAYSSKEYLEKLQQKEAMTTGITSLKISYNNVFGYYIEVRNTHKDKVPPNWIRKQTLANAERYITEELKIYEEKILTAEDKIKSIEFQLFTQLIEAIKQFILPIQQNARVLAKLDCLLSFAVVATQNHYCKPIINEGTAIDIKEGRHPVIEKQLPVSEEYVPNDLFLDTDNQQIIIITGPNMAGKSALLRQTALIVLMAQMGCFVPATVAKLGLIDKVFTRVGAADNLAKGESTFMVEMTETASILNNLSERSLVLMDEIGRGTSTFDGISIAWGIVEFLHNHPKYRAKTLFATHYHELNQLAEELPRVKNFNVAVKELNNKVIFLRKLKAGGSEHSFGIHVAQMAGMPRQIVLRANEILAHLEQEKVRNHTDNPLKELPRPMNVQVFEAADSNYLAAKELVKKIDINTLTPIEALMKLNELMKVLK
jgi:DNA mismatch repair protein MutS